MVANDIGSAYGAVSLDTLAIVGAMMQADASVRRRRSAEMEAGIGSGVEVEKAGNMRTSKWLVFAEYQEYRDSKMTIEL